MFASYFIKKEIWCIKQCKKGESVKRKFLVVCTFIFAVTSGMLQAVPSSSNPTMSRVYGNQFTPQVPDTQSAATIGTLDTTFLTGGSLNLNSVLFGGQAVGMQALPNGSFLTVVSKSGSASVVAQYNAEGVIASTGVYGTSGIATLGTIAATVTPRASMIDAQGRLLVAGGAASGTAGWVARVSTDGDTVTTFTTGTAWQQIAGLAQQSLTTNAGKIIAVGYNGINAQIGRYNVDGTLDTTSSFGTAGLVALDGSGAYPTVGTGLFSVVVDANDNIYVAFIASATAGIFTSGHAYIARLTPSGAVDTSWNTTGFAALSALNSATSGLYLAVNHDGNFIVGAQVSPNVVVTGVTAAGGTIGGFTTFNTSTINGNTYTINNLITTSDDSIFVLGSNTTTVQMAVIRLVGATGLLDLAFNGTGYNLFSISGVSRTASFIQAAGVAVDGQLYTAGYETISFSSITTAPYVSRLNNTPYVSQVAQFPTTTQEQGILDQTFGNPSRQTFSGVTNMFNGLYGSSMMQKANAAIEVTAGSVTHGDIVVGMNGYGNGSNQLSMMLGWLTPEGSVDTSTAGGTIPASGYLTLENRTSSDETLVAMLEDNNGLIYLAGTSSTDGAFVRGYSSFTSPIAAYATNPVASTTAVGLSYQGITQPASDYRTLLCVADTATGLIGSIYGYNSSAVLDTTFGDGGSGSIASASFGLHMGPSYSLVVSKATEEAFIYAAYLDTTSHGVCVAKFQENGSGLIPEFGILGVKQDLFDQGTNVVAAKNIRIGLLENGNLIVAAVTTTGILVTILNPVNGATISGGSTLIAITGAASPGLNLTRVTGVSDGTVMLTFWGATSTDKTMYVARVTSGAILDPTFNSQGSQPGVLPIQIGDKVSNYNARSATCAIIQSTAGAYKGNIAVVGYESVTVNDATPMAMRVYGAPGTTEVIDFPISVTEPGTFDTAYDLQTLLGYGFGKVIFNYPLDVNNDGKMLVGIDTGTSTIVARVDQTMALDTATFNTSGTTPGYVTLSGVTGVNHISIDKQNNILVGGSSGGTVGWAYAINNAGTGTPTPFTMPTSTHTIAAVNNIGQQESGRYIVAGKETTTGKGMLIAFQDKFTPASPSAFAVDPTFNPLGAANGASGGAQAGSYYVGSTGLYTMAINTTYNASPLCNIDTIVTAYAVDGAVTVSVITADGSGFAISQFQATGVAADNSSSVRLNIDGSNNIVVGASFVDGTPQVQVTRYNSAGTLDASFGTSGIQTLLFTGSSSVTLTGLMATTTQQTVLTGYDVVSGSANGPLFAARLVADGALDTIWNTSPAGSDYAGLLTYAADGAINVTGSAIASSVGNIYSIGSTDASASSSHAIVTVVYGSRLVTQISQNPLEAAAGTLDTTIPGAAQTSLPLSGLVTGVPQKIYIYNQTVNSSPNGAMLIASVAADRYAYVTQLNADLSVNTSFATGTSNLVTIDLGVGNAVTITDMYVATGNNDSAQQYIYVTGYTLNGSTRTMFAARILPDGSGTPTLAAASNFITTDGDIVAGCIRQSSNGRVLVSGYHEDGGQVVAYNSAMNAIDTSFGNNSNASPNYGGGYYTTATDNPIVAMTTDSSDRIYIAYMKDADNIYVQRLLENGTELDVAFNSTGTVTLSSSTNFSATQIKLAIDLVNDQLIVAAQDGTGSGNIIKLARFNLSDGSGAGTLNTISIGGSALTLSDLFIDNDSTGSAYPNIYVIGYVSSGAGAGNSVVARVATTSSVIGLDATYGTGGIANLSEGLMTVVTAAALDPDRRVYMVGSNGSTSGYMGRFFGDYYWTERYPAIAQGVVGALDLTLNPNGGANQGGVNLSDAVVTSTAWNTALANGYAARAIIENPNGDGSSYIAFGNGTKLIVGQVDADMVPVTGFGGLSTGLTNPALVAMASVNTIAIDAAGNVVVAGTNSGAQQVALFNSSGIFQAIFNAPTFASTVGTTVAQQKSGRYIVGGYDGSANGLVSAYQNSSAISASALPVDLTFGPAGNNGYYPTAVNAQVDDLVIDSNDYIYIVYRNAGVVNVAKLTPEGSKVTSDNTPSAQVWSTNPITATGISNATQPARIAINQAGNILIGASTSNNSGDVEVELYSGLTGLVGGLPLHAMVSVDSTNAPVLTKLVGSIGSQNEFYGCMYNTAPAASVFGISSGGALDFAPTYTDTQSLAQVTGLSVQYDGKIVAVGYNLAGTASTADPVLVRFYGYPYYSQFAQAPDQAAAGTLDTTLWPTSGAIDLSTYSSTAGLGLGGFNVARIYEYPAGGANNGKALVLFTSGDTVLVRMNKDLTLDSGFGSSGAIGISEIDATSLVLDSNNNIYVAGGTAATGWVSKYADNGTVANSWSNPGDVPAKGIYQVGVQSNSRLITAGMDGTYGTLFAYDGFGNLDNTFGTNGIVYTTMTSPITDIAIDSANTILCVTNNSGTVVLQRVSASGLTITPVSGPGSFTGTQISSAIGNPKVILDEVGNIVVASATTTGFALRRYNNDATGTNNASLVPISVGTSSAFLGNIYATSDGKVTLVGSEPAAGIVVARLTSAFALDPSFNAASTPAGYLITTVGAVNVVNDGMICADDRIMVAGTNNGTPEPYLARVFGDDYVTYVSQSPALGTAGTINPGFGTGGVFDDSTLNPVLHGAQGKAIFPLADGGYYQAFDHANGAANSILIKTVADGSLDTNYNNSVAGHISGIAGSATIPNYARLGVQSILQGVVSGADSASTVLLVGTDGTGGWLQRYTTTGTIDSGFGSLGVVSLAAGTIANVAVEQTLARYVVAGFDGAHAALFAYKSLAPAGASNAPGTVDTTFNAGAGGTPGRFVLSANANQISTLIADQYDRLIFAVLNAGNVDLYRLTPTGELDVTFGSGGVVASALAAVTSATGIRVALDSAGNIVVVAQSSTAGTLSVRAFNNGVSSTSGANGGAIYSPQSDIATGLTAPSVTALVTSVDTYTLVLGNQSAGGGAAWIARITAGGALDVGGFNPPGTIHGIFQYAGSGSTHIYDALAVNVNGTLGMLGYEVISEIDTPTLVSVYNDPYTSQESQSPDSKSVGSIDATLGVGVASSAVTAVADGIIYYAAAGDASSLQVAQAVALYDDNNIVVAIDGANSTSANSSIMINMFDNDGLLNPNFGTAGTAILFQGSSSPTGVNPNFYQNQYVRDMVTFTAGGVTKAILAGYVYNSLLPSANQYSSLVAQYNLVPGGTSQLDPNFGGFDENPFGTAFGDGKQAFVVGQQSTGRIIVGGLSQDNFGLLLGYTADGKLDTSFANDGYQSVNTGTTGIYTHAIDSQNRIVIAYNDGSNNLVVARMLADGSGLDTNFNTTPAISTLLSNSNIKVAVDSSDNVYVAAGITGNSISVSSYDNGDGDTNHNVIITGTSLGNGSAVYTMARTIVDIAGNVIVVAYDDNAHKNVVVRLVNALTLDPAFNGTGYITYKVTNTPSSTTSQVAKDAMVHPDGRIIVVGSEVQ